ncbi:GNAT family N-acetyltransferase [Actinomadura bangladeshensis]|uniref:GNAT family N-acetyltransferase n=1 Tax=Actinomadura bangladeshensis TaxID=453573 RepID=UPI001A9D07C7|nr:GNAT family N-acetyltransferase [Actinomadura bangladeshensis]
MNPALHLRDVRPGDLDAYVRMRCDPVMMAELGGPLPREGMAAKVARDVAEAEADRSWIKMIVPAGDSAVAGTVSLWSHAGDGGTFSEIGWMVLPEWQGRGVAKHAVRTLLEAAGDDGRWGLVHAFPAPTNGPSNGLCRSLGFTFAAEEEVVFAGRTLRANHWFTDPTATGGR